MGSTWIYKKLIRHPQPTSETSTDQERSSHWPSIPTLGPFLSGTWVSFPRFGLSIFCFCQVAVILIFLVSPVGSWAWPLPFTKPVTMGNATCWPQEVSGEGEKPLLQPTLPRTGVKGEQHWQDCSGLLLSTGSTVPVLPNQTWVCSPHSEANLETPGCGEGKCSIYCRYHTRSPGQLITQINLNSPVGFRKAKAR